MSDRFAVGIDFGTSTSEVSIYRHGQVTTLPDPATKRMITPSVVALNNEGRLVTGDEATRYLRLPGRGIREVKRLMGTDEKCRLGDRDYRPEEIAALLLRRLKANAELVLGVPVTDVVLSVPANFADAARHATRAAAEIAGLEVLRLINEPTAAALAFGIDHIEAEEYLLVFDFGGGTLDITILEMVNGVLDVRASYGDTQLGGKDLDEAIIPLLIQGAERQFPGLTLRPEDEVNLKPLAEEAKKGLSTDLTHEVLGMNFAAFHGEPVNLMMTLTRREFAVAIEPLLERARQCLTRALEAARLQPGMIQRVLLVGGTTYVPAVRELVTALLGVEPAVGAVDPDLAVSQGAAVQAALLADLIEPEIAPVLADVTPYGLGIATVELIGGRLVHKYSPLIRPNQTIPCTVRERYSLLHAEQSGVKVRVYQDQTGDADDLEDAVDTLIHRSLEDIPPADDGIPHDLEVELSYDLDGLIQIEAGVPATGQKVRIAIQPDELSSRLSGDRLEAARRQIDELWRTTSTAVRYEGLIDRAEEATNGLPAPVLSQLQEAITRLKETLITEDDEAIEQAADHLTDLLFDIENSHGI